VEDPSDGASLGSPVQTASDLAAVKADGLDAQQLPKRHRLEESEREFLRGVGLVVAHWSTMVVLVAGTGLPMPPRCHRAIALLARRRDVRNEFCEARWLPGTRRPSIGLSASERRTVSELAAASRHRQ